MRLWPALLVPAPGKADHGAMHLRIHGFLALSLASAALAAQGPPAAAPAFVPSEFVRFVRDGEGGHLDTAITTYRKGDIEVVLFGAVHIADQACYEQLNDRFTAFESLLYELVGPSDVRPRKGEGSGGSPVSMLQTLLKDSLQLSFQLDVIDYGVSNFVHADMTPGEFADSMAERGESMLSMMMAMMTQATRVQAQRREAAENDDDDGAGGSGKQPNLQPPSVDMAKAWRERKGYHTLRMLFASQLEQIEAMTATSGKGGSTLLEGRNEKCLSVLQREIAAGRKKLGIYYGAAHLPHLERRLVQDLGFQRVAHEWLVAWDCSPRLDPKYDRELVQLRLRCRDELAVLAQWARDTRLALGGKPPVLAEGAALPAGAPPYAGPRLDPWGRAYRIEPRPQSARWQVRSCGQDGLPDTEDDLVAQEPRRRGL